MLQFSSLVPYRISESHESLAILDYCDPSGHFLSVILSHFIFFYLNANAWFFSFYSCNWKLQQSGVLPSPSLFPLYFSLCPHLCLRFCLHFSSSLFVPNECSDIGSWCQSCLFSRAGAACTFCVVTSIDKNYDKRVTDIQTCWKVDLGGSSKYVLYPE